MTIPNRMNLKIIIMKMDLWANTILKNKNLETDKSEKDISGKEAFEKGDSETCIPEKGKSGKWQIWKVKSEK